MKKSLLVMMMFLIVGMTSPVKEVQSDVEMQTIPDEAIRLRILANSDNEADQFVKRLVRDDVNAYISELVQYMDDIDEAREEIAAHLPEIRDIIQDTLMENDVTDSFTVDYRSDVTFPLKVYDNYVYPAGEYEAVLITIGAGKGANWWCVLFPPLCFLDFSNGTTIDEEIETEETGEAETEDDSLSETAAVEVDEEVPDDTDDKGSEDEKGEDDSETDEDDEIEVSFFLFEWLGWS